MDEEEELFDDEEEELLLEDEPEEEELLIEDGYTGAFTERAIGAFMGMVAYHGDGEARETFTGLCGRIYLSCEIDGAIYEKHDVVKVTGEIGYFVIQKFVVNGDHSWVELYGGRQLFHCFRSVSPERIKCHVPNPPRVLFKWDFDDKPKRVVTTKVRK